ncbi:hypothetical protein NDU88_001260 [Pleurodeles waltl]|uniref:Uncharacterized protein n=1 Tax=Pleurodeles waltl TaxID=8319 RepID=A0AAV7R6J4_PLEWA|nr:hypothetical protein NDU88_001260 [Pleurodeles waltl]
MELCCVAWGAAELVVRKWVSGTVPGNDVTSWVDYEPHALRLFLGWCCRLLCGARSTEHWPRLPSKRAADLPEARRHVPADLAAPQISAGRPPD